MATGVSMSVFAQQAMSLAGVVQRNCVTLQRDVAQNVVNDVAMETPVLTGQAAGNWKTTIGAPDNSYDPGASSGQHSVDEAQRALSHLQLGQTVYITNNVPYIVELNSGSSSKAPAGFVETSIIDALHRTANFNLLIR